MIGWEIRVEVTDFTGTKVGLVISGIGLVVERTSEARKVKSSTRRGLVPTNTPSGSARDWAIRILILPIRVRIILVLVLVLALVLVLEFTGFIAGFEGVATAFDNKSFKSFCLTSREACSGVQLVMVVTVGHLFLHKAVVRPVAGRKAGAR